MEVAEVCMKFLYIIFTKQIELKAATNKRLFKLRKGYLKLN